jgi:hypothetical protein
MQDWDYSCRLFLGKLTKDHLLAILNTLVYSPGENLTRCNKGDLINRIIDSLDGITNRLDSRFLWLVITCQSLSRHPDIPAKYQISQDTEVLSNFWGYYKFLVDRQEALPPSDMISRSLSRQVYEKYLPTGAGACFCCGMTQVRASEAQLVKIDPELRSTLSNIRPICQECYQTWSPETNLREFATQHFPATTRIW